jgi:hypothetical protein
MLARLPGRLALLSLVLAACGTDHAASTAPVFTESQGDSPALNGYLVGINDTLAASGAAYRVARAEYLVTRDPGQAAGQTVFALDRELRLTSRWVPGDTRRATDGGMLRFAHFAPLMTANAGPGLPRINAVAAVDASFATWDSRSCTTLDLQKVTLPSTVIPSAMVGVPGFTNNPFLADINTLGYLPGALFDAVLGPGSANNVLGVTFTFIWGTDTPGGFVPSDIDGDGRDDTAFKEVWYNDAFRWSLAGGGFNPVDIESVALHENGHTLELGHFGDIFLTDANGKLHVSPRAVMNAAILSRLRFPLGTDIAAYCGVFASWPD